MCLFKIHEEEEVRVPARVVVRERRSREISPRRRSHQSVQRVSREYIREQRAPSVYSIPAPSVIPIPAPQPVPVFIEPPPPPPPAPSVSHHSHTGHHYVEVSPRSSVTSHSPSRAAESVVYEREYRRERARERDYSPDRFETYRYVEGAPPSESDRYERYVRRERSRSRPRSRSRDYAYEDPRGSYRETTTRIVIDEDGRRRREYRR